MSDFRNVDGEWKNFDRIDLIWITVLEDTMTKQLDFYIYARDIDDVDEYQLFENCFDSFSSAETFLDEFMGN